MYLSYKLNILLLTKINNESPHITTLVTICGLVEILQINFIIFISFQFYHIKNFKKNMERGRFLRYGITSIETDIFSFVFR